LTQELIKVRAEPGEYLEESYERWRLFGLPLWTALAAGMRPTPGSRMLIGRRPNLPWPNISAAMRLPCRPGARGRGTRGRHV